MRLLPVATTVTDQHGHFVFDNLAVEPGLVYLPGVNRHGVHYPGPRVPLDEVHDSPRALDGLSTAVATPSPLVVARHEIDIQVKTGVVEITETVLVINPTLTTYVGQATSDSPPRTLSLWIPDRFEA